MTETKETIGQLNAAEKADWTIMVYMAGDNNLSEDMAFALSQMSEARPPQTIDDGSGRKRVNLLTYFDSNAIGVPTKYSDFSEKEAVSHVVTPLDLVHPTDRPWDMSERDPEVSGTSYSILNFINWCINVQGRAAKNYAIIFSGHSMGFYGESFLGDQTSGHFMTIRRLRWALEQAVDLYLGKEKIAIVGFDSCEMGMLEVGYELNTAAQTVVSSEGTLPGSGWGYAPLLKAFFEHTSSYLVDDDRQTFDSSYLAWRNMVDSQELTETKSLGFTPNLVKTYARLFVKTFINQQRSFAIGGRTVDMAAYDLDKIADLAAAVGALGESLLAGLAEESTSANKALSIDESMAFSRIHSAILQSHVNCQTYLHEQSVDIKDFCQFLQAECETASAELKSLGKPLAVIDTVAKNCAAVVEAIDSGVLAGGFVGDQYQYSNGISVFFPWTAMAYHMAKNVYPQLRLVRGENHDVDPVGKPGPGLGWNDFLVYYLYYVTLRRSRRSSDEFALKLGSIAKSKNLEGLACVNARENLHIFDDPAGLDPKNIEYWMSQSREDWLVGLPGRFDPHPNGDQYDELKRDWRDYRLAAWKAEGKEDWDRKTRENWEKKTREAWDKKIREDWQYRIREDWPKKLREDWENYRREEWAAETDPDKETWDKKIRENWEKKIRENWAKRTREDWPKRVREDWEKHLREETAAAGDMSGWTAETRETWDRRIRETWDKKIRENWEKKTREDWPRRLREDWEKHLREAWEAEPDETKETWDKRTREDWERRIREDWAKRTREDWPKRVRENWEKKVREDWAIKTREDWTKRTREDWPRRTRESMHGNTREDWPKRLRENMGGRSEFFDRIKNFQLNSNANGYWPEPQIIRLPDNGEVETDGPAEK